MGGLRFGLLRRARPEWPFSPSAMLSRMLRMMDTRMLPIKADPKLAMEIPAPSRLTDR